MTKEELMRILAIDKRIKAQKRTLAELREESTCIPAFNSDERVQTSARDNSMAICRQIVDLEREIGKNTETLKALKQSAEDLIKQIKERHGGEITLMRMRYLECRPWHDIATVIGYTWRHTLRIHGVILATLFD